MGHCCTIDFFKYENKITYDITIENGKYEELLRENINNNKFMIQLKYNESKFIKVLKPEIKLDVIHVDTIGSTMPASKEYIDKGNTFPFIYNTIIQTAGVGKGNRKWAGGIIGNLYTSTGIPLSLIKNDFRDEKLLIKITSISIIKELNKLIQNKFYLKHPNDILCEDKCKLGGILTQKYKDFYIIGFGINIIDKPEKDQVRPEGLSPCYVKAHLPKEMETPTPLNLSIEITKNILYNLNLSMEQIDKVFEHFLMKNM